MAALGLWRTSLVTVMMVKDPSYALTHTLTSLVGVLTPAVSPSHRLCCKQLVNTNSLTITCLAVTSHSACVSHVISVCVRR